MQLYITKSGTAFKVSTYSVNEPVQPWTIDHPDYKTGQRAAAELITKVGMDYAQEELKQLRTKYYTQLDPFERGILSEVEQYIWCVKNNEKYYSSV